MPLDSILVSASIVSPRQDDWHASPHCVLGVWFICLGNIARQIFADREEHMTRAAGELQEDVHSLGESSAVGGLLCGLPRRIGRREARAPLSAPLWLTSLQKPGVFEIVPTENVSRFGIQMVTQEFWEPAELVLVSSPPGFCVQGSVVYCKKLPSDDYILGIRLDAPVEHWIEALGFRGS